MLLPVMDYGGLFLTMCTKKELDDLQIIQNNALRCCLKVQDPRDIHLIVRGDFQKRGIEKGVQGIFE